MFWSKTFVPVFIKSTKKRIKTTGAIVVQYRLCESYRIGERTKHTHILHLGTLEMLPDVEQKRSLLIRINDLVKESRTGIKSMFIPEEAVEQLAQRFFAEIRDKKRMDLQAGSEKVFTDSICHKEVREIGAEYLCHQVLEQLELSKMLSSSGWSDDEIQLAKTHIISRAVYPASELKTTDWIRKNSAVCTVSGYPLECITKDKLYSISKKLYSFKDELEQHLSRRTNELFDLEDRIIIYDLTNTYYEGSMRHSKIAKFGRSKEKRSDAKLIVLAVVINREGFLKYTQLFEGNMSDSRSLQHIIDELTIRTSVSERRPTVVMDAGIASEDNLQLLKKQGFDYMVVSRSGMKQYKVAEGQNTVVVKDNKGQPISLRKAVVEGSLDTWLEVYSENKAKKETGMNGRFSQQFEEGLGQIKSSLNKKGGIKKLDKVWERIGRLKQKCPSIHRHYEIEVVADDKQIVTQILWQQKVQPTKKQEGHYLLRTTMDETQESVQWQIYNTIREVESTMRVLKTDLDLRPIYHKTDKASMAHLHLGLLAYWVVNTIRYQLKQKGIHTDWRNIVRTMNTQKMVTSHMVSEYDQPVILIKCSEPIQEVQQIYEALHYKQRPFTQKKSVLPPPKFQKNENQYCRGVRDD